MLERTYTLDTVPALVFVAAVVVLIISAGILTLYLWQQRELSHLHEELYTLRVFRDSVEFVDERPVITSTPAKKPRPIPEGLEVIHPAVNR